MLLDGLTEAAILVSDGRVTAANDSARARLGQDIAGAPLDEVVTHPAAREALERAGSGEEVELTGLDGSRRHWLMRTAQLPDGSGLIRFLDRSEARAAEQMRVDFVANASHELRTPLSTLIGYTETLREQGGDIDPETRDRFLGVIDDEAHRMQSVVEDLISLSRIEAERFSTPTDAVGLPPLIAQVVENCRRAANERESRLDVSIAAD